MGCAPVHLAVTNVNASLATLATDIDVSKTRLQQQLQKLVHLKTTATFKDIVSVEKIVKTIFANACLVLRAMELTVAKLLTSAIRGCPLRPVALTPSADSTIGSAPTFVVVSPAFSAMVECVHRPRRCQRYRRDPSTSPERLRVEMTRRNATGTPSAYRNR